MYNISVVTICFNNLEELKLTINSVDKQSLTPFEHIIVNGSTNNEIQDYLSNIHQPDYRVIINEIDGGISDAFNKGIRKSTGQIVNLLNSGDEYFDGTIIEYISKVFDEYPNLMWIHGKYQQEISGKWITLGKPFNPAQLYKGMSQVGHPTMFVKKELYERYGYFDLNKKIAMDYDFLVRIKDEPFKHLNKVFVRFKDGGASNIHFNKGLSEVKDSYQKYIGSVLTMRLWQIRIKMINKIVKSKLGKTLLSD